MMYLDGGNIIGDTKRYTIHITGNDLGSISAYFIMLFLDNHQTNKELLNMYQQKIKFYKPFSHLETSTHLLRVSIHQLNHPERIIIGLIRTSVFTSKLNFFIFTLEKYNLIIL